MRKAAISSVSAARKESSRRSRKCAARRPAGASAGRRARRWGRAAVEGRDREVGDRDRRREFFDAGALHLDTRLAEDLDLDSIDAIDMAVRIEEKCRVVLGGADLQSIETLQEVVDLIHERI
jgi:acyl carrier protein